MWNDERTVCFTGHRPKHLPWGDNREKKKYILFRLKLTHIIETLIVEGYTVFTSGMAIGSDMICASVILNLKTHKYPHIKLNCCLPFREVNPHWTSKQKEEYEDILSRADNVFLLDDEYEYDDNIYMIRNMLMIDMSDFVIGIYNGNSGGTKKTLNYAKEQNKKALVLNPNNLEITMY